MSRNTKFGVILKNGMSFPDIQIAKLIIEMKTMNKSIITELNLERKEILKGMSKLNKKKRF